MSKQERPADTRVALLEAAMRVIAAKGLRGLTFRAAASEAGLSHGMILHHFGTRERLIESAMEYSIGRSLSGAIPGDSQLGDHVLEVAEDADGVMAFQREIANEALRNPSLSAMSARVNRQYEAAVASQLRAAGVEDPDAVVFFAAAMNGLVHRQMDMRDPEATQRALDLMNRLVAWMAETGSR